MTEQQLREKLQFAYGNMPDATRAAFEHSLTHHRAPETHRNIGLILFPNSLAPLKKIW